MFPLHAIKNAIVHLWYANFSLILSRTRKVLAKYIISFEFESGSSVELNQQLNQSDRGFSGFGDVSAAGAKLLNSKFCVIYVLTKEQMAFQACRATFGQLLGLQPQTCVPLSKNRFLGAGSGTGMGINYWVRLLETPPTRPKYLCICTSAYPHIYTSAHPHIHTSSSHLRICGCVVFACTESKHLMALLILLIAPFLARLRFSDSFEVRGRGGLSGRGARKLPRNVADT